METVSTVEMSVRFYDNTVRNFPEDTRIITFVTDTIVENLYILLHFNTCKMVLISVTDLFTLQVRCNQLFTVNRL
jgi:hypothetical protein